nr:Protein F37A4.3 [Haemonchus contortus]
MRRWRSLKPSLLSGAVLGLVLIHVIRSILTAPLIFPKTSPTNPLVPVVIAFVTSTDPAKTALCEETWLKRVHSHIVFTSQRNSRTDQIFLPHRHGSLWSSFSSKALFADRYLPHHYSWYIMTSDDTYVLVEDLMQDLAAFDPDEPYMAVVGPTSMEQENLPELHAVIIVSRGAMNSFWDDIQKGYEGCAVTSEPSSCLNDIVHLNLREDAHKRLRYLTMQRHFARYKEKDESHTLEGYNDGAQVISMVFIRGEGSLEEETVPLS